MPQIRITDEQKADLDGLKQHHRETYEDVVGRLIDNEKKRMVESK